jgi:hypothetical protein
MTLVSVDAAANVPGPDQDDPPIVIDIAADEVTADVLTQEPVAEHSDGSGASRAAFDLIDELIAVAREAAVAEAGRTNLVGGYQGAFAEDEVAVTAEFDALDRGYLGWRWSVTLALVEPGHPTISEVVLLPGAGALLAPPWVPWDQRIRAGDLGAGGLLPTAPDDVRLVPGYVESEDPAIEDLEHELGIGRVRVLSREGRDDAAQRWHDGPFGPEDTIAQLASGQCITCGFYVPLAGALGTTLGVCANEFSPADGRVVDAAFGCGAHSEARIDAPSISAFVPSAVDELVLEVHVRPGQIATPGSGQGQGQVEIEVAELPADEQTLSADAEGVEVDVDWATLPTLDGERSPADY